MSNPFLAKAAPIATVILSALVIVACVGGILITWFLNFALGSLVVDLSVGVEKTAQALQRGTTRMETGVTNLQTQVQSISQAASQISQNIADEGLVRTLLPSDREASLDAGIERVTTSVSSISDAVSSARDFYRAVNRIPGINLPEPSPESTSRISGTVTQVRSDVQDLKSGIQRVRGGAANTVNQLAEVADRVSEQLGELLAQLQTFNTQLTGVQTAAQQLRRTVPVIITISAVLLTLLQLWVIFTQYVMLRLNWGKWRTPAPALALSAAPGPAPLPPVSSSSMTAPPPASSPDPAEPKPTGQSQEQAGENKPEVPQS